MGLFQPKWMTNDFNKRIEAKNAVAKISDPLKLKDIALRAPLDDIKFEAARRISDQNILKEIVLSVESFEVKTGVCDLINDEAILRELYCSGDLRLAQFIAVCRLNDELLLKQVLFTPEKCNWKRAYMKAADTFCTVVDLDSLINIYSDDAELVRHAEVGKHIVNGAKYLECADIDYYLHSVLLRDENNSWYVTALKHGAKQVDQDVLASCELKPALSAPEDYVPFCPYCGGALSDKPHFQYGDKMKYCRCERGIRRLPLMVRYIREDY